MIKLSKNLTQMVAETFVQDVRCYLLFVLLVLGFNSLLGQDSNHTGFGDSSLFDLDTVLEQVQGYNSENSGTFDRGECMKLATPVLYDDNTRPHSSI